MTDETEAKARRAVIYAALSAALSGLTNRLDWSTEAQADLTVALLEFAAVTGLSDFVDQRCPTDERIRRFVEAARKQLMEILREGQS